MLSRKNIQNVSKDLVFLKIVILRNAGTKNFVCFFYLKRQQIMQNIHAYGEK